MQIISSSPSKTKKIAKLMAEEINQKKTRTSNAIILGLRGELGSGKTTFAQGFARGLGIKNKITSPTFLIIKNYNLKKNKGYKSFYHIDVYRIKKVKELNTLNFKNVLKNKENIILIEWAEKIINLLPHNRIGINLRFGERKNERIIKITNFH